MYAGTHVCTCIYKQQIGRVFEEVGLLRDKCRPQIVLAPGHARYLNGFDICTMICPETTITTRTKNHISCLHHNPQLPSELKNTLAAEIPVPVLM